MPKKSSVAHDRDKGRIFDDVLAERFSRRTFIAGTMGATALSFLGGLSVAGTAKAQSKSLLGFPSIPTSKADQVTVPPEYTWEVVNAWGDPIVAGGPEFKHDASQSAADQAKQAGMGHDGMHFFPLPKGSKNSDHGLIAINFEYTDDGILHKDGMADWSAEKVQKSKNAHGLGVMEVRFDGKNWKVVKDSKYGRRITADTPFTVRGPAAGHEWIKTKFDPEGKTILGTFNNCANGYTPWGTYLSCEENVTPYFIAKSGKVSRLLDRYGIDAKSWGFRWHEFDPRFDADAHPNEPNRHGWVVEFDPYDPTSTPIKRTAMGRCAHEGAALAIAPDGRVVYYMGDDDFRSKFEHIFKFVSARPYTRDGDTKANIGVLDDGTLYAAKCNADGTGAWIELTHGKNGLTAANGFRSQAEVVIDARTAGDVAGATYFDRPEWIAVSPVTGEVYCTLSNNSDRGKKGPFGVKEVLGADPSNPRAPNPMGHIIRWREDGNNPAATTFKWDIFMLAGDPKAKDENLRPSGILAFANPDGIFVDQRGVVWIQTDASASSMSKPDWAGIGNNQMLAADPASGDIRRFLTGVPGCEITAAMTSIDGKTMFVNIQHPGETPDPHPARNKPENPKAVSGFPNWDKGGRPRSALIAVRRKDGGIIGT
jgi:secreted PhoX family phosphatase